MRKIMIIVTAAMIAAIPAIWGATAILAKPHKATAAAPAPAATSIGVMEMMKNAKELPEQQFDAH
jgi:hypothetical protein